MAYVSEVFTDSIFRAISLRHSYFDLTDVTDNCARSVPVCFARVNRPDDEGSKYL